MANHYANKKQHLPYWKIIYDKENFLTVTSNRIKIVPHTSSEIYIFLQRDLICNFKITSTITPNFTQFFFK